MHSVKNVLIVGAGMCGMSLGVALKRAGINCEIVEIRPKLTEPGPGYRFKGRLYGHCRLSACWITASLAASVIPISRLATRWAM